MLRTVLFIEPTIRLAVFLSVLAAMTLPQVAAFRRRRDIPRTPTKEPAE